MDIDKAVRDTPNRAWGRSESRDKREYDPDIDKEMNRAKNDYWDGNYGLALERARLVVELLEEMLESR